MTIGSLSGVGGLTQSQNIRTASSKLQAAISSIVSGSNGDTTTLSTATQLQSQVSTLRQASSNLAQASSITQVADGGSEQIQNVLIQLQSLAQQANSPTLNASTRSDLNQQFTALVSEINQLANNTSFGGQNLLDGSLSGGSSLSIDGLLGSNSSGNDSLSISSLSASSLLPGSPNILSADTAGQALSTVNNALSEITGVRATIGSFQQSLNFASANVDSAINNQEAASSTLSETDFASASTTKDEASILQNAAIALLAQGNKLSPALLQLVG